MYIFFLFFQFTMIPETTKDPGSICAIAKYNLGQHISAASLLARCQRLQKVIFTKGSKLL